MNISRLRVIAGACAYLLLAFSVSANAQGARQVDTGISIESWLSENGQDIPVLSFDGNVDQGELADDIQVENIILDKDGSTRYQLSHTGPLSRQVFANVRSVAQEGDLTRSVITNIADGGQTEYLSRTAKLPASVHQDKISGSNLPEKLQKTGDQETECLTCIAFFALGVACVVAESRSYEQCRQNCQGQGGISSFDSGFCGSVSFECTCWTPPRENVRYF